MPNPRDLLPLPPWQGPPIPRFISKEKLRIGFTGTEVGMTEAQRESFQRLIQLPKPISEFHQFHHGDCIGSDEQAHNMVKSLGGITIHIHPPLDPKKRAFCTGDVIHELRPYLERNKDIVDSSNILIATPRSSKEEVRSGTWATIRYARRRSKLILIIYPDGKISGKGE